ncbi:MAG: hypothetical protein MHM6MM_001782 [Cercozoa sp. M6MM]
MGRPSQLYPPRESLVGTEHQPVLPSLRPQPPSKEESEAVKREFLSRAVPSGQLKWRPAFPFEQQEHELRAKRAYSRPLGPDGEELESMRAQRKRRRLEAKAKKERKTRSLELTRQKKASKRAKEREARAQKRREKSIRQAMIVQQTHLESVHRQREQQQQPPLETSAVAPAEEEQTKASSKESPPLLKTNETEPTKVGIEAQQQLPEPSFDAAEALEGNSNSDSIIC